MCEVRESTLAKLTHPLNNNNSKPKPYMLFPFLPSLIVWAASTSRASPLWLHALLWGVNYLNFSKEPKFTKHMEATHHKRTVETGICHICL